MAVKTLRIIIRKFFWTLTILKLFSELLVSLSIDRAHLLSAATNYYPVIGFIF